MRNEGYAYTSVIGRECDVQSVLEQLASVYAHSSAEAWRGRLQHGEVTLDGVPVSGARRLRLAGWDGVVGMGLLGGMVDCSVGELGVGAALREDEQDA